MHFPHPFHPDMITRAGRMMAAGRCKVTVTDGSSEHITVLLKAFADNRDRKFDPDVNSNWVECQLEDATHVFTEVPTPSGEWNDKIGTYYPRSGRWFDADDADARRVRAAILAAIWITNPTSAQLGGFNFRESDECGKCGLELSDPVSLARGYGPTCFGKLTGSKHAEKWRSIDKVDWAKRSIDRVLMDEAEMSVHHGDGELTSYVPEATPENVAQWQEAVNRDSDEDFTDLGLNSAGENAMYQLAKGLDLEQLLEMHEWLSTRIVTVRTGLREAATPVEATDSSFMAR